MHMATMVKSRTGAARLAMLLLALMACSWTRAGAADGSGFGGAPLLGPEDQLRQLLKPYDLVKLNVLGANYCENLLDMRLDTISYTHLGFDSPSSDAWHLQFPDDAARYLEAITWEAEYSPVVRLETARRLIKGFLAARVPGTPAESFFRHRSGGKTFLIFGDPRDGEGRVVLSNWGDAISGAMKVGCRVKEGDKWISMAGARYSDEPKAAGDPDTARSAAGGRYWNESPYVFRRHFAAQSGTSVDFTGRYWLSDDNRPLEFGYARSGQEAVQIVVGEPGTPIPLLGDYRIPTSIHLPDRRTVFRSDRDGDRIIPHPAFHYLVLRKPGAWGANGYSAALLVMWDGNPDRIEAIADKGYGELRISYPGPAGRIWLYPYYWLDEANLDSIFRSAEHFLTDGTLLLNGFPSQQFLNAIPAGLASGAYLLVRYHDPMAPTAVTNAARAVDQLFAAEDRGEKLVRVCFPTRAAAWMVRTAKALHDRRMEERYTALLDRAVRRMCSPEASYDGKGWASGWDHFNCMKACRLAYDATGNEAYLHDWERALTLYTIDEHGLYRDGKPAIPGDVNTYFGTMPMAVWGNAGMLDRVNTLINLDVPNGWSAWGDGKRTVRSLWNDAGAGPWAQDDANPEFVGFSLRGARIPQREKYILPVGAFPDYDAAGHVRITRRPLVHNPFFLPGQEPVRVLPNGAVPPSPRIASVTVVPGSAVERGHAVRLSGAVRNGRRTCTGSDGPLVYRFSLAGATDAALDMRVRGDGFRIDVSPDGKRWFERLDTKDADVAQESLDVSFLAGSREELVRLETLDNGGRCRYAAPGGSVVYRLDLPNAACCLLEMLVGNGYRVDVSSDGRRWRRSVSAADPGSPSVKAGADAAVIRMLDVSDCLRSGSAVYLRVADERGRQEFAGHPAFVRRISAYGTLRSGQAWVRVSNVSARPGRSFTIERVVMRTWRRTRAMR
jgi:hypothetical protein